MVAHDQPRDGYVYRHVETDDFVEYIDRGTDAYRFRVNRDRTLELRTEDWPAYREHLRVDKSR